jgi:hypothetical protein
MGNILATGAVGLEQWYWISQIALSIILTASAVAAVFQIVGVRRTLLSQGFEEDAGRIRRLSDLMLNYSAELDSLRNFDANSGQELPAAACVLGEAILDELDTVLLRKSTFEKRWGARNLPDLRDWMSDMMSELPGLSYCLYRRPDWYTSDLSDLAATVTGEVGADR